jgi:hypothetical protein
VIFRGLDQASCRRAGDDKCIVAGHALAQKRSDMRMLLIFGKSLSGRRST